MLSSTAKNLYWMARYIQRAENTARVLEATNRMALLSNSDREWRSVPLIYGLDADFAERHPSPTMRDMLHYLTIDEANPSSVASCFRAARNNARDERNNLTIDLWESLNGTWLELQGMMRGIGDGIDFRQFLDWTKKQAVMATGAAQSTLLRDDAYNFVMLGLQVERADNTARILDVKYHILLPKGERVGGSLDYYQWAEVLSCIGAYRTYRRVYSSKIEPWRVAELMILRHDLPRSLLFCLGQVDRNLGELAELYGARGEATRLAGKLYSKLRYARIDTIFQDGLHEYLSDFIRGNARLSEEISRQFLMG
ncbi:MAG: alpha-E domain-containing protein [Alphaproteobacteria bacterium]|nr:alpha-E domain-containing protein [Alphaproteobacteria bacterium]